MDPAPARFEELGGVDVVVLLQTNGEGVLRSAERTGFERWAGQPRSTTLR